MKFHNRGTQTHGRNSNDFQHSTNVTKTNHRRHFSSVQRRTYVNVSCTRCYARSSGYSTCDTTVIRRIIKRGFHTWNDRDVPITSWSTPFHPGSAEIPTVNSRCSRRPLALILFWNLDTEKKIWSDFAWKWIFLTIHSLKSWLIDLVVESTGVKVTENQLIGSSTVGKQHELSGTGQMMGGSNQCNAMFCCPTTTGDTVPNG